MTTAVLPRPPVTAITAVTFPRVVRSEWIKLSTIPAYAVSVAAAFIVLAGFGALAAWARVIQTEEGADLPAMDAGSLLGGIQGAQLVVALGAAVFATSEHAQQTVQPSFLATPRRLPILAAKALLVALASFAVGAGSGVVALLTGTWVLDSALLPVDIPAGLGVRLVAGAGLYLAAVGVVGLGLGVIVRSTVAGLLTTAGLLTVAPLILGGVPVEWIRETVAYLPTTAGLLILRAEATPGLSPWGGLGVAGLWAVATVAVAAVAIRRADA